MINHIINSLLLALGLGVDSFSISLVNGISYPNSNKKEHLKQSLIFGICQSLMPFIGYILLVYFSNRLTIIKTVSPYISLVLLSYLGIKLIMESFKTNNIEKNNAKLTTSTLILQGIATSIDAVSCSFSMINLSMFKAVIEITIIGIVTVVLSYLALSLGKEIGRKVEKYSQIIGGIILILIGIILFVKR